MHAGFNKRLLGICNQKATHVLPRRNAGFPAQRAAIAFVSVKAAALVKHEARQKRFDLHAESLLFSALPVANSPSLH